MCFFFLIQFSSYTVNTINTVKSITFVYYFFSTVCITTSKSKGKAGKCSVYCTKGKTSVVLCCITACVCVRQSVCAWTEWLSYSQTLFMVGMLLGSLFGGAISDRYHCLGKIAEKQTNKQKNNNNPPSFIMFLLCCLPCFCLFYLLWRQVWQAPSAAGVPVLASCVRPRPCRSTLSVVLPGCALLDGLLLLLHQHQLLQPR